MLDMGSLYVRAGRSKAERATFENGTVYSPGGALSTGHEILMYYDGGRIYRYLDEAIVGSPVVLARCDKFGRIKSEDGDLLGSCENGRVKDAGGWEIAFYEGDSYGAAAAACAVLFGLGGRSKPANAGDTEDVNHNSGGGSDGSARVSVFSFMSLTLLCAGTLLRKLIKTAPFWGPYVFTLVMSCILVAPAALIIPMLPILISLVLHAVLLLKCRKREGRDKYQPVVISFLLYLVSFFLLGIPAVIYQLLWLIRNRKTKRTGGTMT